MWAAGGLESTDTLQNTLAITYQLYGWVIDKLKCQIDHKNLKIKSEARPITTEATHEKQEILRKEASEIDGRLAGGRTPRQRAAKAEENDRKGD